MRRLVGAPATLANAAVTLAPQLVALVTLGPQHFGKFSVVYLVFAWGVSLQLSIVCEPLARAGTREGVIGRDFRAAATWVALFVGALAGVVAHVAWTDLVLAVLSGVAVAATSFRVAARYGALLAGDWTGVLRTDCVGTIAFVTVGITAAVTSTSPPVLVLSAWCASSVLLAICGPRPYLSPPTTLVGWIGRRRAEIVPLLKDSIVLDASSIATPYALAPLLGFASFGIYRAVSNVAAPVRLVIEPLRPTWATLDEHALRRVLRRVSIWIAVPLGVLTTAALMVVGRLPWTLGVLSQLSTWAVAAGIFVALSMISHLHYIAARLHAPATVLWRGRLLQSGTAIVLPLTGAFLGGLAGAMWTFVAATAIGALVWARYARHRPPEAAPVVD